MRHEHLVVTVESGTKERIDADLDAGESLEAWVADAVERKLAEENDEDAEPGDDAIESGDDAIESGDDDYDEGFEYVDDCGI